MNRCRWPKSDLAIAYHDHVWCVPCHDERLLYKYLILEGLQAGLSWETILNKEAAYTQALDNFDYHKIAKYDEDDFNRLMTTPILIHNKLKNRAIISNAKAFEEIQSKYQSFDNYIWTYVDNKQIKHHYHNSSDVPAFDELSTTISKDLKKAGFKFVGPTIIYSYLQAIGVYNDHEIACDLYKKDY